MGKQKNIHEITDSVHSLDPRYFLTLLREYVKRVEDLAENAKRFGGAFKDACMKVTGQELLDQASDIANGDFIVNETSFNCSSCEKEFIGDPVIRNGCKLCLNCQHEPLYTAKEIANYLGGWATGGFDEVSKLGQAVTRNALFQPMDIQDGIEANRERRYALESFS